MKKIILFFAISCIASWVYGQGEMDAFRLSGSDLSGSARGVAMGGAFGALGGDITGIAQNPAGIGVYRSSEMVTTLSFASVNTETKTLGRIEKDSKFNFDFSNFAYIAYVPLSDDVKAFNFGFTYNRLKNFNRNYLAKGNKLTSSLTDYIANFTTKYANVDPDDLYSYDKGQYDSWPYEPEQNLPWISVLGYNGGLIMDDGEVYISPLEPFETVDRTFSVSEQGYIDTYDFTMGANILDKLYLGLTLSLTEMRYGLYSCYTEEFALGGGYDLYNSLNTEGAGCRISVGAIYRPTAEFRIGLAYHSQTWYNLIDCYYAQTERDYDTNDPRIPLKTHTPYDAAPDYRFTTPDRWVVSLAGILGKKAILSLDYEYSDYSKMKLKSTNGLYTPYYQDQNDDISKDFTGASSLKLGMEYKVTPQLALRAGYAWMQSPLEKSFKASGEVFLPHDRTITAYTLDGDINYFSYGAGYRFTPNFYMDLAFSFKTQTNQLYAYSGEALGVASVPSAFKNNSVRGLLTLGYKF